MLSLGGAGGDFGGSNAKRVNSIQINQSNYGTPVPIIIGRQRVSGTLIWFGDFVAKKHKQDGGKGGGGENSVYYTYKAAVMFGICEGPVRKIPRVYQDRGMMADATEEALVSLGFTKGLGAEGQSAWSYLVSNHPTEALAYSGTCWVAHPTLDLDAGAGIPTFSFDVEGLEEFDPTGTPAIYDALPRDMVNQLLTNPRFGAGYSVSSIGDLNDWATYCIAADFFLSCLLREQTQVNQTLQDIANATNSAIVWSQGALNFRPYGDEDLSGNGVDWFANVAPVYNLDDNDFVASEGEDPITFDRVSTADAYNSFQLEFNSRQKDYNRVVVTSQDQASIDLYGIRPANKVTATMITRESMAQNIVDLAMQRVVNIRLMYTFTLKQHKILLEPMDVLAINDAQLGLVDFPVRITAIEEDDDFSLKVTAEMFVQGVGTAPGTQTQAATGFVQNSLVAPGDVATPVFINPPPALVNGRLELWAAVAGQDPTTWGGAEVWVSIDGTTYAFVGTIREAARYGSLTADLDAANDPDTTNTLSVDLSVSHGELESGVQSDADAGVTQCWVGGELLSYQDAAITALNNYDLTYLRRGLNGSMIGDHPSGTEFVRLDQSLFVYPYAPAQVGQTLYIKFVSFNVFGQSKQNIADVTPYTATLGLAPNPLMTFSVDASAGNGTAIFSWQAITDMSVTNGGSVEIRFFDGSGGASDWNAAVFVGAAAGNATQINLPYTAGTYLAKTRTSSAAGMVYSNDAAVVDTSIPPSGGLTASASPTSLMAMGPNSLLPLPPAITTGNCTATVAGGTVPYHSSWTRVSGSTSITAVNGAARITQFQSTQANNTTRSAVFKCSVTDDVGAVIDTNTVAITITRG